MGKILDAHKSGKSSLPILDAFNRGEFMDLPVLNEYWMRRAKEESKDDPLYPVLNWIGKALPNEMSKLNSYSKYLQYIPYVGKAASVLMNAGSALDAGSTAYVDTKDKGGDTSLALNRAIGGFKGGVSGTSQDPGIYGSSGKPNRDWANTAGQIGNYLPSFGKSSSGKTTMKMGQNPLGAMDNPYFTGKGSVGEPTQNMFLKQYTTNNTQVSQENRLKKLLDYSKSNEGSSEVVNSIVTMLNGLLTKRYTQPSISIMSQSLM